MHNEFFAPGINDTASQIEVSWQRRLDALVSGQCTEDDFLDELSRLRQAAPNSAWNLVAWLEQRYRRGQIPGDLFRSIESKIAERELGALDYDCGTTDHLHPAAFAVITQRFGRSDRSDIPAIDGPGNHEQTAGSSIQTTQSERPSLPMDDRSVSPVSDGRVLRNRYVLESRLGSGGMGFVFKAMDRYRCDLPEGNRHVAIKFLHAKVDSHPEVLSNLRREFYCAQALSHSNIVRVYELDKDDDVAFFTMEFLDGQLLSSVIERLNPLSIYRSYAWTIILQVGAGLAHAHARNVVHADLKPQNIMITNSGEVRILDFGASSAATCQRSNADEAQKSNSTEVTPAYACCEVLDGQQADPRDDLYALACVSYELLAGEHPFQGRTSIEARDLGLIARRPPGLTWRQWRTLAAGLSWSREGRSIPVRDWIAKLNPGRAAARRLVRPRDLTAEPTRGAPSSRTVGLLAVLLASLLAWAFLNRSAFERKINGNAALPSAAVIAPINTEPVATHQIVLSNGQPLAELTSMRFGLQDVSPTERPAQAFQAIRVSRPVRRDSARSVSRNEKREIGISAGWYRIGARENFAEIHVRRSPGFDGDTSFVWWTEPSSAKPGSDYAPQGRITRLLPKGRDMASLFIKVMPNASRKHSAVFYVAIGDPSNGTSLGRVARSAIWLPPSM
jgi:serine/threonine protein kinase